MNHVYVVTANNGRILGVYTNTIKAEEAARKFFMDMGFTPGKVRVHSDDYSILPSANIVGVYAKWERFELNKLDE